jgi:prolipoprotein diacylglyceryltransferase
LSPAPRALAALGEALTRRLRPRVRLAGRTWPVYGVCVCSGAVLAAAWMVALAAVSGAPPLLALAVAAAGIAGALALAYLTRAFLGAERFTFYHYQLAILAAGGAVVAWAGGPALTCLDVLAVGLAVVQAVGRLGCLGAGCCHGRAVPWGVRYGHEHGEDGFPHRLVGVALAPVQAFESLALWTLAAGGSALVIAGRAPGSALALYLAGYATARFLLERWRGDSRPSFAGLSEAQWTALAAMVAVTALGAAGRLPLGRAGVAAGLALLLLLAAVALADRSRQAGGLLSGAHWTETAALLSRLMGREEQPVEVRATSHRLYLSTGLVDDAGRAVRLVSFSAAGPPLDDPIASRLALRLSRHLGADEQGELRRGERGVWHLLVPLTSNAEGA